jgi:hypothetical protein
MEIYHSYRIGFRVCLAASAWSAISFFYAYYYAKKKYERQRGDPVVTMSSNQDIALSDEGVRRPVQGETRTTTSDFFDPVASE